MHCEKCAQGMKKGIQKLNGVEAVEADLKNSEVTVKGVYDPAKLVKYVYKKFGKQSVIVKQELEPEKKETEVEEGKEEEKKGEEDGEKEKENEGEENKEKKEVEGEAEAQEKEEGVVMVIEETKVEEAEEEVKIIEYFHNNNDIERNGVEMYAYPDYYKIYPPQIFSDENPNACTIM